MSSTKWTNSILSINQSLNDSPILQFVWRDDEIITISTGSNWLVVLDVDSYDTDKKRGMKVGENEGMARLIDKNSMN